VFELDPEVEPPPMLDPLAEPLERPAEPPAVVGPGWHCPPLQIWLASQSALV
jgi:hypothetical protein